MGARSGYEPGVFCWVDLATTDPDAAKDFYAELFGWRYSGEDGGAGNVYSHAVLDGDAVAGIYSQPPEQRAAGAPPGWFSYVTVSSADQTASRAVELGGSLLEGPFDVPGGAGRRAAIADPTGAAFGAWQPGSSFGAERVNDPGCLTANELATGDVAAATDFYSALFGWRVRSLDTGGGPPYWLIDHDGAANGNNGGIRALGPGQESVPAHWMPYFTVASLDAAIERATRAGGTTIVGPLEIPAGRIAAIDDPQGAGFALFEGDVDD